jgi:hypothetical protein
VEPNRVPTRPLRPALINNDGALKDSPKKRKAGVNSSSRPGVTAKPARLALTGRPKGGARLQPTHQLPDLHSTINTELTAAVAGAMNAGSVNTATVSFVLGVLLGVPGQPSMDRGARLGVPTEDGALGCHQ